MIPDEKAALTRAVETHRKGTMHGPVNMHSIMQRRSRPESETPIIDAARREMCSSWPTVEGPRPCHYDEGCGCEMIPTRILATLRSVCPKEPPDTWIASMKAALKHRLPAWIDGADMIAEWQAQPLWRELWGKRG